MFYRPSSGRQASDALYAFGNILQNIHITFRTYWQPEDDPDISSAENDPTLSLDFKLGGFFYNDDNDNNGSSATTTSRARWLNLPQLKTINVNTLDTILKVHPCLLARSPKLDSVLLEDRLTRYSFSDVVYWEPAHLPDITSLVLKGTPAISFHPNTLKSTRKLESLALGMRVTNECSYIPDPEDFEHNSDEEDASGESDNDNLSSLSSSSYPPLAPILPRRQPVWTWDWDLPHLGYLCLASEFAYRFEFRMLNGTPNLGSLEINFNSESGRHSRTIGMEDLIKPGFQHPSLRQFIDRDRQLHRTRRHVISYLPNRKEHCLIQQQKEDQDLEGDEALWRDEFELIHLPKLHHLTLSGPWVIDYRPLKALFSRVAPQIQNIDMLHPLGFTAVEFFKSTSENLPKLYEAMVCSVPINSWWAEQAGLVSAIESEDEWDYGMRYELAVPPVGRKDGKDPVVYTFLREDS